MEGYFRQSLAKDTLSDSQHEELKQQIAGFIKSPGIEALVLQALHSRETPVKMRVLLLEAIAQASVDVSANPWASEIAACIEDASEPIARQAVLTARPSSENFLRPSFSIIDNTQRGLDLRIEAAINITPNLSKLPASIFDLLLACAQPKQPALLRAAAADAIGRAHLSTLQQEKLTKTIATAGPLEMPGLLAAFEHGSDPEVGRKLVAAIDRSPASKNLRPELVSQTLHTYPAEVQHAAEPLLKRLSGDVLLQKAHLDDLSSSMTGGDPLRGRTVFFGSKVACAACHAVTDQGAHVGPDLSKIGTIRTPRDLLESIVYPSASFARGYEPYMVKTKDGDVLSGVISQQTADAIYLVTGPREVKRITRANIVDLRQGTVSIMPQGFDTQLTRQELADLIAFLGALK
jgi:putative heme-binding domain-containing protein